MSKGLSKAQINHLRRLLGWVRCSDGVFQSPEEMVDSLRKVAPYVGTPDEAAKHRLAESYAKAQSIPLYVRAALKALAPVVLEAEGQVVDVLTPVVRRQGSPANTKDSLPRQQPRLKSPKGGTPEGRALLASAKGILK